MTYSSPRQLGCLLPPPPSPPSAHSWAWRLALQHSVTRHSPTSRSRVKQLGQRAGLWNHKEKVLLLGGKASLSSRQATCGPSSVDSSWLWVVLKKKCHLEVAGGSHIQGQHRCFPSSVTSQAREPFLGICAEQRSVWMKNMTNSWGIPSDMTTWHLFRGTPDGAVYQP